MCSRPSIGVYFADILQILRFNVHHDPCNPSSGQLKVNTIMKLLPAILALIATATSVSAFSAAGTTGRTRTSLSAASNGHKHAGVARFFGILTAASFLTFNVADQPAIASTDMSE